MLRIPMIWCAGCEMFFRVITEISPIFKIIARISPTSCSDKPLHKITQINPLFEEITQVKASDIHYRIRVCVYISPVYPTIKGGHSIEYGGSHKVSAAQWISVRV